MKRILSWLIITVILLLIEFNMVSTVEQDFVSKTEEPVPLPVLVILFVFGVAGLISLKKKGMFK